MTNSALANWAYEHELDITDFEATACKVYQILSGVDVKSIKDVKPTITYSNPLRELYAILSPATVEKDPSYGLTNIVLNGETYQLSDTLPEMKDKVYYDYAWYDKKDIYCGPYKLIYIYDLNRYICLGKEE